MAPKETPKVIAQFAGRLDVTSNSIIKGVSWLNAFIQRQDDRSRKQPKPK
jgi:hypothetical protein